MRDSILIVSSVMFCWLIFAAVVGYLARPKSESDPMMDSHGDVPGEMK